jgi:PIN domain nuclease of toxin-antitoxin system
MNVLLDTCALIWVVAEPDRLMPGELDALKRPDTVVHFSPISSAEVACMAERKWIEIDRHWKSWFNYFVELNRWQCMDITLDIIQEAYSLPGDIHRDPADRIIVATARLHQLTIITGDRRIIGYPHVRTLR